MPPRYTGSAAATSLPASSSKSLIALPTCFLTILDSVHRAISLDGLSRFDSTHTQSSTNPLAKGSEFLPFAIRGGTLPPYGQDRR